MPSTVTSLQPLDPLKVFVEYDTQHEVYVAQCLQTGHLVTADNAAMAKEMIRELLTDEVSLAVKNNDISSLLSNPAPMELWFKYEIASKVKEALESSTITIEGEVPQKLRMLVGQSGVATEIRIVTGKTSAA